MSNYISISGPFGSGLKPKSFFAETKNLYRSRLMQSELGVKAKHSKYTFNKKEEINNPYMQELLLMAPWIIAGSLLLVSIF